MSILSDIVIKIAKKHIDRSDIFYPRAADIGRNRNDETGSLGKNSTKTETLLLSLQSMVT